MKLEEIRKLKSRSSSWTKLCRVMENSRLSSSVWYVALRLLRKTVFSMSFVSAKVVVEEHNSCKNCREVDGRCTKGAQRDCVVCRRALQN